MGVPRLTIPTAINALDEDVYADDGGYPSHAALGYNVARNDRALHAHCRRTLLNQAFPIADLPRSAYHAGHLWGPWDVRVTPGLRRLEWKIRAAIETDGSFEFVPFISDPPLVPYRGPSRAGARFQSTLTDGGAGSETTYAGLHVGIPDHMAADIDALRIGFVLHAHDKGSGETTGNTKVVEPGYVQSDAGSFAGFPSDPVRRIIRLVDGAGAPISAWRDVTAVRQIDIAGDTADVHPPWDEMAHWWLRDRAVSWAYREVYYADLYSVTCREVPLTGSLDSL
jgi:hypothetical protein|tara:strand:+ start:766 stop:1611 length:846 start_codon:yes stop_codon:yes gene_type:complete